MNRNYIFPCRTLQVINALYQRGMLLMKNEKEIWLNPEDVQQLLEGGLYWKDIEPKLSPENLDSFRRQAISDELEIEEVTRDASENKKALPGNETRKSEENDEVRAILLGEMSLAATAEPEGDKDALEGQAGFEEDSLVRTSEHASIHSDDETEVSYEEKNRFLNLGSEEDTLNPGNRGIFSNDSQPIHDEDGDEDEDDEESSKALGGLKLVILLAVVASLTFGFWYYYLSK